MEHFAFGSSGKDIQFLPSLKSGAVSHFFHQFHLLIFWFVQIVENFLGYLFCSIPFVCSLYAKNLCQFCQGFFTFDLSLDLCCFLHVQSCILHNVDIAAGAAGNCTQEVSCHDNICSSTADSSGSFWCDPAWAVGAETAAHALKAEAAFCALSFYSVMRSFHWKAADKSLQRLVRTGTGIASITLVHFLNSSYVNNCMLKL